LPDSTVAVSRPGLVAAQKWECEVVLAVQSRSSWLSAARRPGFQRGEGAEARLVGRGPDCDRLARATIGLTDSCALIFSQRTLGGINMMSATQPRRLRFHIMFDTQTRQIARGLRDATQLRLFLLLPSFCRWDAWHRIDEARIAAELEITPEEVNKALAELVLRGLVLRNDRDDRPTGWRLSSVWGRKGSFREVQADIAETDRAPDAEAA
jgi:hypothetical protein